jgi:hypothetical protein
MTNKRFRDEEHRDAVFEDIEWLIDQGVCEADLYARWGFGHPDEFRKSCHYYGRKDLVAKYNRWKEQATQPLGMVPSIVRKR